MSKKIYKRKFEPTESSVYFDIFKNHEILEEWMRDNYDLDKDGILILDNSVYIQTVEETFEEPYVYIDYTVMYTNDDEEKLDTYNHKFLNTVTYNNVKNATFGFGSIFEVPAEPEDTFVLSGDNVTINIFVDNFEAPSSVLLHVIDK